jgi:hypothetical protein
LQELFAFLRMPQPPRLSEFMSYTKMLRLTVGKNIGDPEEMRRN